MIYVSRVEVSRVSYVEQLLPSCQAEVYSYVWNVTMHVNHTYVL